MNVSAVTCEPTMADQTASSNRYVSYVQVPTLQKMASHRIARAIWYSYVSSHSSPNNAVEKTRHEISYALSIPYTYQKDCAKMVESLKTPTSIEEMLKSEVQSVNGWMYDCIKYFYFRYYNYDKYTQGRLDEDLVPARIEHFNINWCVWSPNGKIDFAKTASKMANSAELNLSQKFFIICKLCMEDEILNFPLHLLPDSFVLKLNLDRDLLMCYWVRYLRNELHEIPLDDFPSLDVKMAVKCSNDVHGAFKYFWHRLGEDDQVLLLIRFDSIEYRIEKWLDYMLSTMSWPQQRRLLDAVPDKIVLHFSNYYHYYMRSPKSAIWAWTHTKDTMTPEQFTKIVNRRFNASVSCEDNMQFFLELWHSASDEQRSHAIQTLKDEPLTALFSQIRITKAAWDFVYMYLSAKSKSFRKRVMLRNAKHFVVNIEEPNLMNEIIQLCLPNPADQLKFKKLVMESEYMESDAVPIFNDVELENLTLKMKYFSIDDKSSQAFVERFLAQDYIDKLKYLNKVENWNKFSQFVDGIHSQDATSALNFKKEFIISYAKTCHHHWNDDSLDETDQILKMVFTDRDELQQVKKYFLDSFEKLLMDLYSYWFQRQFNEKNLKKFVLWCLNGDEKALAEFMETVRVRVDDIFRSFFDLYNETGSGSDHLWFIVKYNLLGLDTCLKYFKGVEGARQYKLKMANSLEEPSLFSSGFCRGKEWSLDIVLKWIFDDDEESVRKYKMERIKFEYTIGFESS